MTDLQIAKLLGHASTATTRRYTHLNPTHLRATVDALDEALSGGNDTQVDTRPDSRIEQGASGRTSSSARIT